MEAIGEARMGGGEEMGVVKKRGRGEGKMTWERRRTGMDRQQRNGSNEALSRSGVVEVSESKQ